MTKPNGGLAFSLVTVQNSDSHTLKHTAERDFLKKT